MIDKKILIDTINKFAEKRKEHSDKITAKTKETFRFEDFLEYEKFNKAWAKLQEVVEFEILPFTE